jgi:hypothetical protein
VLLLRYMTAHIATITDVTTPAFDAGMQPFANAFANDAQVIVPPADEASIIDAQERAVAEQTISVIMGQIQQLEAELGQADPEEKGDIASMISVLSGIKGSISSALTSGDGKALTRALSVTRGEAINNALDETDDKDTFAGQQADVLLAESNDAIIDTAPMNAALQARNIMNFSQLDAPAQTAIAEHSGRLISDDTLLSTLFTTQTLVQNDAALQAVFERTKTSTNEALKTVQTIAQNTSNEGLQNIADELTALEKHHGVQHAWLPATLNSLSQGRIDAQTFLDTATRYIAEEHVALDAMAQKSYALLPDYGKHIMHDITGTECSISDMVAQLDAYKKQGFLDSSLINNAFSDTVHETDDVVKTLALFDSAINLQQSLLNMQMHFVNMPDNSKRDLAEAMKRNADTVFNSQQSPDDVLKELENLFTGKQHIPVTQPDYPSTPPSTTLTGDVVYQGKLEQEKAQEVVLN